MKQIDLIVHNASGLHARPATVFVNAAKQFTADIWVKHGAKKAKAKSVISLLTLGVKSGSQIQILADGSDEDQALETLKSMVEAGLGDEEEEGTTKPAEKTAPGKIVAKITTNANGARMLTATPAAPGVAIGSVFQFRSVKFTVEEKATDLVKERETLDLVIETTRSEIKKLRSQVLQRMGTAKAEIFDAHLMILNDPDMLESAYENITLGYSAAWSWRNAVELMAAQLAELKDELLAARAADVRDVGNQVLRTLVGAEKENLVLPEGPVILCANDLLPSDTVTLDTTKVLGFCTATGGANAHTAILARALALPAIVGAGSDLLTLANGTPVILNGEAGTLTIEPTEQGLAEARRYQRTQAAQRQAELEVADQPAITQDGHRLELVANIGSLADAQQALKMGAEGVGLLRTEFLFLDRSTPPTEDEQFIVYRDIAQALEGKPLVIRTLDVGGDKPLAYLPMPTEEDNPFLGQRGIRLCLVRPEILRTQLRAILRASSHGDCRIMFPMISSMEEWRTARQMITELQQELNVPKIEVGIMIEVPAAAVLAKQFSREVDFFSIGTNDLTQYTLAMDRTHPNLSTQADGLHPAILQLISLTVKAAHAAGKWVGVCGELAANSHAVPILVGLGVDELSVSSPAIPTVKAQIRGLFYATAQELAGQALECDTAADVRALETN